MGNRMLRPPYRTPPIQVEDDAPEMTTPRRESPEIQWDLIGLFFILVMKWWVIVLVFLAAIVVSVALWLVQDDPDPVYEATTKLLIVAPISDRILSQSESEAGSVLGPGLSVDTILDLATAKDLYQTFCLVLIWLTNVSSIITPSRKRTIRLHILAMSAS